MQFYQVPSFTSFKFWLNCVLDSFTLRNLCLTTILLDFSVGVGAFVIGLSQISSFSSYYRHLFPAAVWNVVTRFPGSGFFKCHHLPHSNSDLVVWWIPLHYGIFASLLPDHLGLICGYRTESDIFLFLKASIKRATVKCSYWTLSCHIHPPPPQEGFCKAIKCFKMSHVSTLAVGAFWGKTWEIMQKSLKIGNDF